MNFEEQSWRSLSTRQINFKGLSGKAVRFPYPYDRFNFSSKRAFLDGTSLLIMQQWIESVSYTHLTLPTSDLV